VTEASERTREPSFAVLGAVFGFLAVAAGAFGAHALRASLPEDRLQIFETGARYQMFHALVLLVLGFAPFGRGAPAARWAGRLFAAGIVLFSGSLYVLALSGVRAWGAVTPFGGVAWLVAWAMLAVAATRARG
jgi:uncharacterized membrane protein YgdD (TMEM256/DUF423 family)